jgi:hypothetical protein
VCGRVGAPDVDEEITEDDLARLLEEMRPQLGVGARAGLVVYLSGRLGVRFGNPVIRGMNVVGDEACDPGFDAAQVARRLWTAKP